MKYKIDDVERVLREKDFDVFVNGVNCTNHFGSGIAAIISKIYPEAKQAYHNYCKVFEYSQNLSGMLGNNHIVPIASNKWIIHSFTQEDKGYDGKKYASYDAIDECFRKLADILLSENSEITYPLIGAGLGGLQWSVVKEIIDYRLQGLNHFCIVRQQDVDKYNLNN